MSGQTTELGTLDTQFEIRDKRFALKSTQETLKYNTLFDV